MGCLAVLAHAMRDNIDADRNTQNQKCSTPLKIAGVLLCGYINLMRHRLTNNPCPDILPCPEALGWCPPECYKGWFGFMQPRRRDSDIHEIEAVDCGISEVSQIKENRDGEFDGSDWHSVPGPGNADGTTANINSPEDGHLVPPPPATNDASSLDGHLVPPPATNRVSGGGPATSELPHEATLQDLNRLIERLIAAQEHSNPESV